VYKHPTFLVFENKDIYRLGRRFYGGNKYLLTLNVPKLSNGAEEA
jgi:hypothetical protein